MKHGHKEVVAVQSPRLDHAPPASSAAAKEEAVQKAIAAAVHKVIVNLYTHVLTHTHTRSRTLMFTECGIRYLEYMGYRIHLAYIVE